jgi:hypothetical protein
VLDDTTRTGRVQLEGDVSAAEILAIASIVEPRLDDIDVLIVITDGVTRTAPDTTRALATLAAMCRPPGIAFVLPNPSDALVLALDDDDFGEHLAAGRAATLATG